MTIAVKAGQMRLTQVSRQTFVGIDLPGPELRPAALPLAILFGLAELASFGEPSVKSHTCAGGTRDQPLSLVKDVAFDEAYDFAGTNHSGLSAKLCVPDWPQEVDFQFDGSERVAFCEGAAISNAHRGVCQITEHSAVKCSHRIRVSSAGFEIDRGSTGTAARDHQTQKLADRSGKLFRRYIWGLFDDVRCIELDLRFRRVRVASQIAIDLAVCELLFVIFIEVIQFLLPYVLVYTRTRPQKFRPVCEKTDFNAPSMSQLRKDSLCAGARETVLTEHRERGWEENRVGN